MTLLPVDDPASSHVAGGAPRDVIDLRWWAPDRALHGLVRVDVSARRGATAFLAAVLGPGRPPVVVLDHDLPLPAPRLELRTSGIWTDLVCETPLEHWTIGLEAFGLAVEPGAVVTPETFGDRVPVGLDLDVETVGDAVRGPSWFTADVHVHGEVLVADEAFELDGRGMRQRRWDGRAPGQS